MINFVQKRRLYFAIAAVLILLSLGAMLASYLTYGQVLRVGIDFTGGSLFVLQFQQPVEEQAIREVFTEYGFSGAIIQQLGNKSDNLWQVRAPFVSTDEVQEIMDAIEQKVGPLDRTRSTVDTVEPTLGAEVARQAGLAVLVSSIAVLLFIWYSFRRIPHPFRYGVAALIAMTINVIVTLGFYALMGLLQGWEVDALFLTALLTVIGFSVQDVIVVFDRIRENIPRHPGEPFEMIVNRSVMETVHRSLATQLNAMFVMIAIILFGGATLKPFISVMLVGMISETFTSLCVAVPFVVVWEEWSQRKKVSATAAA